MKLVFYLILVCANIAHTQTTSIEVQTGHSAPITDVIFSADDRFIISSGEDSRVVIWDRILQKQFGVLTGHTGAVTAICTGDKSQANIIYSVSLDGRLKKWDFITGQCLKTVELNVPLGAISYSPSTKQFLVGSHIVHVFNAELNKINDFAYSPEFANNAMIQTIQMDKSGNRIAFSDGNTYAAVIFLDKGLSAKTLIKKPTNAVSFNRSSDKVFCAYNSGGLSLHDVNSFGIKRSLSWLNFSSINDITYTKSALAFATASGEIHMLNEKSMLPISQLKAHSESIQSISASSDSTLIVSASLNGVIKVWDLSSKAMLERYQASVQRINDVCFIDSLKTVISLSENCVVTAFNIESLSFKRQHLEEKISGLNKRKSIYAKQLHVKDGKILIDFYKTKLSAEVQWAFDFIQLWRAEWDLKTNTISRAKRIEDDEKIKAYYALSPAEIYKRPYSLLHNNKASKALKYGDLGMFEDGHSDKLTSIDFSTSLNYFITGSWDGLIKFWRADSNDIVLSLGLFDNNQFALIDKDNNYFSSRNGLNFVNFKLDNRLYSFDQFDLKFNRPDKVFSLLQPLLDKELITRYNDAYHYRLKKTGIKEADLEFTNDIPELSLTYAQSEDLKEVHINIECQAKSRFIKSLQILVNGVPEYGYDGIKVNAKSYSESLSLNLSEGENIIKVQAINSAGLSSLKQEIKLINPHKAKHDLYLITLGGSVYQDSAFNLSYAEKDASDVAEYFRNSKDFNQVHHTHLVNDMLTKTQVADLEKPLMGANQDDVVILFAAGHGLLGTELDFYLASYNVDFNHPEEKGIPYELLENLLAKCQSRKKCMFLDACHSGEIDKDLVAYTNTEHVAEGDIKFRNVGRKLENSDAGSMDLSRAIFADMRPNNGATVISSAGGVEFALEGDKWKNGVFTYCLLKGLKKEHADHDNNGDIYLSELHSYILDEVSRLTNGQQTPTSRVENLYNDFKLK